MQKKLAETIGTIQRLVNATGYSLRGLRDGWRTQPALRYEFWLLLVVVPAAWVFGKGGLERAVLIGSWVLVIVVELINSAIESAVDRMGPEHHELSGRAKDLGSAAVLLALVLVGIVWILVIGAS